MTITQPALCRIWNTPATDSGAGHAILVNSARAGGEYRLASSADSQVAGLSPAEKARLTTWIVDQHRSGIPQPLITTDTLGEMRVRKNISFSESRRRLFLYLSARNFRPNDTLRLSGPEPRNNSATVSAWTESQSDRETAGFVRLMADEGLFTDPGPHNYRLTSKGFEFLEAVQDGGAATNQAFVAMWFDASMDEVYSAGIEPAVRNSGFTPFRVDQKETNKKIDDEIIAEIRRSRFLIADFTCGTFDHEGKTKAEARGGVYFEAGFAIGLNMPVIWSARRDCIDLAHFDTRQFAHVVWETPEELRVGLQNRIGAVIV